MCTLVAVWMWVPRQQDLTMMGTNGCLSVAPLRSQTALFVLTNQKSPLSPGGRSSRRGPSELSSDEYRRSIFFCFPRFFFHFLFFFSPCCQVGSGACKWHNHVHHSLSVLCISFTIQQEKKTLFSSITFFFKKKQKKTKERRKKKSRMMRHM